MTHNEFDHILNILRSLSPGQMLRLRQQIDSELAHHDPRTGEQPKKLRARPPAKTAKRTKAAPPQGKKPLPIEEIHRQMMASGLITALPDPALDIDDDDPDDAPVPIKGVPLSETIIRERR